MVLLPDVVSPKLTGRIAQYANAITEARLRGVTWGQIAVVLGPDIGLDVSDLRKAAKAVQHAHSRACVQIAKGRLRSGEVVLPSLRSPPSSGTRSRQVTPADAVEDNAQRLQALGVQVLK
ncbi:MAG: hypothetical protein WBX11_04175 [Thiobacillaceae bacterium]